MIAVEIKDLLVESWGLSSDVAGHSKAIISGAARDDRPTGYRYRLYDGGGRECDCVRTPPLSTEGPTFYGTFLFKFSTHTGAVCSLALSFLGLTD